MTPETAIARTRHAVGLANEWGDYVASLPLAEVPEPFFYRVARGWLAWLDSVPVCAEPSPPPALGAAARSLPLDNRD